MPRDLRGQIFSSLIANCAALKGAAMGTQSSHASAIKVLEKGSSGIPARNVDSDTAPVGFFCFLRSEKGEETVSQVSRINIRVVTVTAMIYCSDRDAGFSRRYEII